MTKGQINFENIKPGRRYFSYNVPTGTRKNDISCIDDKRYFKRIYDINTGVPFNRSKRNSLINNSLPGTGKSWESLVGYDFEKGFFNSTINSFYKSLPFTSNGKIDLLSFNVDKSNGIYPQQYTPSVSVYWSNGMLYSNSSKIFENYLDCIDSVIHDLEELIKEYDTTTDYIKSSYVKDPTDPVTKSKDISTEIYHDINDWIGKEVYLITYNSSRVSRIIDYFSFSDIKSVFFPPTKVKVLGQTKGKGYGIDFITEDGSIIKDLYVFSSTVLTYQTKDECAVKWNRINSACLNERERWKEYANDILDKYKTIKEKGGKKLKEYDITQYLYYR